MNRAHSKALRFACLVRFCVLAFDYDAVASEEAERAREVRARFASAFVSLICFLVSRSFSIEIIPTSSVSAV
jgi:hypothetical protein